MAKVTRESIADKGCLVRLLRRFFSLINFYWSIVDLQYYVSFRCTAKGISYTYIHSFLDSFPI